MSRSFVPLVVVIVIVAAWLSLAFAPVAAHAAGSATLAPLGVPSAKLAVQELKYAFGKQWQAAMAAEVKDDLVAAHLFSDVVPEGGDVTFTLDLKDLKRSFDDRVQVNGWGVLTFNGSGRFSWSRAGSVVSEGTIDVAHVMRLDRQPWRTDLTAGWREVLRKSVVDAVAQAHDKGVLDAAAPGESSP